MIIGVPIAIGIALFISHYAARRIATALGAVVDLLAAVPSLVFGMWGLYFLIPKTQGFQKWLADYFSWIPLFDAKPRDVAGNPVISGSGAPLELTAQQFGKSLLIAGVVLAIMIIPVVSAVCREVFLQVPTETKDAAWALGSTKWEMIRTAVLPFGRAGMISAAMLGLGRALGETIAVALVLNSGFKINYHLNEVGGDTFASTDRPEVRRGQRIGARHPGVDHRRPVPVRDHPDRQLDRSAGHRAEEGVHRMTATLTSQAGPLGAGRRAAAEVGAGGRRIGRAIVLGVAAKFAFGWTGWGTTFFTTAGLFLVLFTAWSFSVEGRRRAKDRFASTLIYACFVAAVVPLVLILGYIAVRGLPGPVRGVLHPFDERRRPGHAGRWHLPCASSAPWSSSPSPR